MRARNNILEECELIENDVSVEEDADLVSLNSVALILVATFVLFLFGGAFLIVLFGFEFALVFSEILLVVLPLGYLEFRGINIREYVKLDLKIWFVVLGGLMGFVVFLYNVAVTTSLVTVFGVSVAVQEASRIVSEISSTPQGLLLLVVTLSLAGVCEEFTFRGFLQTSLKKKYPFWVVLLISSIAFGILHFDPQLVYTLSAFMTGLLLGYLYNRWNSIVVPIVAHASMNLIVLAISLFFA